MIVPMKKIHLIVQKKDVAAALENLAGLGLVHIEHCQIPEGKPVERARETVEILDQVLAILTPIKDKKTAERCGDWKEKATEILDLQALISQHKEFIDKRTKRIETWEAWGDFEPQDIRDLAKCGVFVQLYEVPASVKNVEVPAGAVLREIGKAKGFTRYVCIKLDDENLPYDRVYPPPVSLSNLKLLQAEEETELEQLNKLLWEETTYFEQLKKIRDAAQYELDIKSAEAGMYDYDRLCFLKGFIPEDHLLDLQTYAKKQEWGVLVEDPEDGDDVPTKLKNKEWVNLSKPAFDLIEILPGYSEVDISPVFLVFFTLFFAMLIGDAAYGMIFGLLTAFIQVKFGKKIPDKTPFFLMYLLTGFCIVFGVLTGTYFGQAWLPDSIQPVVPWLNETKNIQLVCFVVAVIHLTIARLWAFKQRTPSILALAQIGWLLVVWGMFFVANYFVLGYTMPGFAVPMIGIGAALALFFMAPPWELPKKIGQEAIPFLLGIIGAGTDIVSYIRLFAVGVATVAVADAANSMWGVASLGIFSYGLFIFLHLLNMVLALMAILVHAVRLNVLEFSGHLGLEWAGVKYQPLQKTLQEA